MSKHKIQENPCLKPENSAVTPLTHPTAPSDLPGKVEEFFVDDPPRRMSYAASLGGATHSRPQSQSRPPQKKRGPCAYDTRLCSVSLPAWEQLQNCTENAQRIGHFKSTLNLLIHGEIITLALPQVGNGPFHAIVETLPQSPLPRTVAICKEETMLHIGPWRLSLEPAPQLWDPHPDWDSLELHPEHLALLHRTAKCAARHAPTHSPVVRYLLGHPIPEIVQFIDAVKRIDQPAIHAAAAQLAGWGPGLTPSGDDFLAGAMLGLWSLHHNGVPALHWIYEAAAPRTTRLSRAFLRAARDGMANEHWHWLLQALNSKDRIALDFNANTVLNFGASSGLDMVTGYLILTEHPPHALPYGYENEHILR